MYPQDIFQSSSEATNVVVSKNPFSLTTTGGAHNNLEEAINLQTFKQPPQLSSSVSDGQELLAQAVPLNESDEESSLSEYQPTTETGQDLQKMLRYKPGAFR